MDIMQQFRERLERRGTRTAGLEASPVPAEELAPASPAGLVALWEAVGAAQANGVPLPASVDAAFNACPAPASPVGMTEGERDAGQALVDVLVRHTAPLSNPQVREVWDALHRFVTEARGSLPVPVFTFTGDADVPQETADAVVQMVRLAAAAHAPAAPVVQQGDTPDPMREPAEYSARAGWDASRQLREVRDLLERSGFRAPTARDLADRIDWIFRPALEEMGAQLNGFPPSPAPAREQVEPRACATPRCRADSDGDCTWGGCPQLRDGEPKATGRHCPYDWCQEGGRGCSFPACDCQPPASALASPAPSTGTRDQGDGGMRNRDGRPMDEADAWAKSTAADVLQSIADGEPDEDTIEAQELLSGTAFERMYVLNGSEIEQAVYVALSNAFYDRAIALAPSTQGDAGERETFQQRVHPWMLACFGEAIAADRQERCHRFLEEGLELVQSLGCTASEAHQLVDYVFGRDTGEPHQEAGGVMVTLAALCNAAGLRMDAAAGDELARVWTKVEAIRAKHAAKPTHSPLPESAALRAPVQGEREREMVEIGQRIATQENRATAAPLFAVQQRRRIYGLEGGYTDDFVWCYTESEDGGEVDAEQAEQLERAHRRGDGIDANVQRVGYRDEWEFVTACFTEQGCKDFIARDGHNLTEPRIYAYGSYRNHEWRAVRDYLIALAAPAPADTPPQPE